MLKSGVPAAFLTLCVNVFFFTASGSFPRAQNVTWTSTNFKTLLTWEPKPTSDYSYTVEYSEVGKDRQRSPHCIRTTDTVCDLTTSFSDVKATYSVDVLSEPPRGATSDLIEFPYTKAERFCPYTDTEIGKPDFKIEVSKDQRKTTLYVTDPPTALFEGNRQLNIRDIFSDELQYKVIYRKATSTGKKEYISKSSEIELTTLDRGESYCFTVQAYIPSRSINKRLGDISLVQCSRDDDRSPLEEYSFGAIAGVIAVILLVVGVIIAVTVVCCKRRRTAEKSGKEGVPLRDV